MKKTIITFAFITILFISCRHSEITEARIEVVHWEEPIGGKNQLLVYKITFEKNGKRDSSFLLAEGIYQKGTYYPFFFETGDSIFVKLARGNLRFYYLNKFMGVKSLVPRKESPHEKQLRKHRERHLIRTIDQVDKLPLLPDAKNNDDNQRMIKEFYRQQFDEYKVTLKEYTCMDVKIDTLGRMSIEKIYSTDNRIMNIIDEVTINLPDFTPAEHENRKVIVATRYEVGDVVRMEEIKSEL